MKKTLQPEARKKVHTNDAVEFWQFYPATGWCQVSAEIGDSWAAGSYEVTDSDQWQRALV